MLNYHTPRCTGWQFRVGTPIDTVWSNEMFNISQEFYENYRNIYSETTTKRDWKHLLYLFHIMLFYIFHIMFGSHCPRNTPIVLARLRLGCDTLWHASMFLVPYLTVWVKTCCLLTSMTVCHGVSLGCVTWSVTFEWFLEMVTFWDCFPQRWPLTGSYLGTYHHAGEPSQWNGSVTARK